VKKPTCMQCKHFYITFDPQAPKGCRIFQFASVQYPSVVVERESGSECSGFQARTNKTTKPYELDLNDPKNW
jgi:hypothetical protein